jgi:prepilin-type N-terminal cleavage/methylation domain-containing protein
VTRIRAPASDAGFALIEILVALVIASMVAMAIGGLLLLSNTIRGRVAETGQIESTLVDVESLTAAMSHAVGLQIADPTSTGFDLVPPTPQVDEHPSQSMHFTLVGKTVRVEFSRGLRVTMADVSIFDQAALEYFLPGTSGRVSWTERANGAATPLAVRLRLRFHGWVWRPLLWIWSTTNPVSP